MQFLLIAALLCASANALAFRRGDNCITPAPSPGPRPVPSNKPLPCGATTSTTYTVVKDDTLGAIAKTFSSGVCDIASLNNITNPNSILPGQILTIPKNCTNPDNTSCLPDPAPPGICVVGPPNTYTVRTNDTLTLISTSFSITLAALEAANPQITNPDLIFPGQVINIPVCPGSSCTQAPYVIKSGDTLFDLAAKYGATAGQEEAANTGVDPTTLQPGMQIVLVQDCKNGTTGSRRF